MCPFTIQIVNLEGTHYYQLEHDQLGALNEVTDAHMKQLIEDKVGLTHTAKDGHTPALCGTFFVNLSIFKP